MQWRVGAGMRNDADVDVQGHVNVWLVMSKTRLGSEADKAISNIRINMNTKFYEYIHQIKYNVESFS